MAELIDKFKRRIDYLRVSVTDRCNLRCIYCMPEYGILQKAHCDILTFEELKRIVSLAVGIGIDKVKITGGEPLVRKDLPRLIYLLSSIPGLADLSLTTNGMLVQRYAKKLKNSGLKRLNISIDTLNNQKFKQITRFGRLEDVLAGIDACIKEGLFIKLNVVLMKGLNDNEVLSFVRFAGERGIIVKFIELMPIADNRALSEDLYISCNEVKDRLKVLGNLMPFACKEFANGPAQYYKIENTSSIVGFISPISCKFCYNCSRLRLTADGFLMPCLSSKTQVDLKTYLRKNQDNLVLALLKKAVFLKPQGHNFSFSSPQQCLMSQIGG